MLYIKGLSVIECLIFLVLFNFGRTMLHTARPLKPKFPFAFMWNAPSELCESRFGIDLDLSYCQLVSSTLRSATNQSITIFYTDRFGIYPYLDEDTGEVYSQGLPQLVDIKEHRELAEDNITLYIPDDQPGLAILDFEEWRPQWARNWGSMNIYREVSIDMIMQKYLFLSHDEAEEKAKKTFEAGAKKYFLKSVNLGKKLRPQRLWGYYLYPDCYNYDYNQDMKGYTGKCPDVEKDRNDELVWLWEASTALYPSIYLELTLKDSRQATLFVRHRMQESMRVSTLPNESYSIPIYAYIRIVYKDSGEDYLSMADLVSTIGEAAALGAAGVVSWGDMNVTESQDTCSAAERYLEKTLNPYILNVTTAARLCSSALCNNNGRCVRKKWSRGDYLHLNPSRYRIKSSKSGELSVKGRLSQDDIDCTLKTATNQSITIFYTDRFGIFPYFDEETGEAHNEGLPQLIDFEEHSELAEDDIMLYIPDDQPGLAVLDFEEWRPQWVRNWGGKGIYKTESIDTIMQKNLFISRDEAEDIAKKQFEAAAKEYFMKSIDLGKTLRPKRLWGYYLYPDCYNYDYNQDMVGYTGKCPEIEINRNDELLWLWESSTALYPSVYLELKLKDSRQATLFVRHRIQESMRVSMLPNKNYAIPIYAYIRIVYKDHGDDYLSKEDLVSTIGEAAALGAAGVVSWGDMNVTESKGTCSAARRYLEKTLNPYLLNVTTAAKFCSKALCSNDGHCVRKKWDSDDYLHLDPSRYRIKWSKTANCS
ncbi:hypothetical protein GJAV_G00159170 [Gymnothorax javanicus]|nr:hypothetical protein GJAV_G00159170 [Gymnothorax javanicus]